MNLYHVAVNINTCSNLPLWSTHLHTQSTSYYIYIYIMWLSYTRILSFQSFEKYKPTHTSKQETNDIIPSYTHIQAF
jgi:hypothetical protein